MCCVVKFISPESDKGLLSEVCLWNQTHINFIYVYRNTRKYRTVVESKTVVLVSGKSRFAIDSASNINEYHESSTGKAQPARKARKLTAICEPIAYRIREFRCLTFLLPSRSLTRLSLPLFPLYRYAQINYKCIIMISGWRCIWVSTSEHHYTESPYELEYKAAP
jgi:hypothetical protein